MRHLWLALLGILVGVLLVVWFGGHGPEGGTTPFVPAFGPSAGSPEGEAGLYVLRLTDALPADWRETLRAVGAEPGGAFAGGEWLVRATPAAADRVLALPFVREMEELPQRDRVAPALREEAGPEVVEVLVTVFAAGDKARVAEQVARAGGSTVGGLDDSGRTLRVLLPGTALREIARLACVLYVEPYHKPEFLNDRAAGVVGAGAAAAPGLVSPAGLTGAGQVVAVADSGLDTGDPRSLHPDFQSRPGEPAKVVGLRSFGGAGTAADPVGHGTHVAGTVAGTGAASGGKFRGLAPGARLYFQGLLDGTGRANLPTDLATLYGPAYAAGARIQVNGWGTPGEGYGTLAAQADDFVWQHPDFLVLFGAGNEGREGRSGSLGAEAQAKNVLVVGASENPRPGFGSDADRATEVAAFSSRGPAADGRIKPDLVAPGTAVISTASGLVGSEFKPNPRYAVLSGTSQATAVAAGAATLLREYLERVRGVQPSAALLRALLINGARPLAGGREAAGFGLLDLGATLLALHEGTFRYGDDRVGLPEGAVALYEYTVTDDQQPLKVTLAWTDPPAVPGSPAPLVNDLHLVVVGPDGRQFWGNDFTGAGRPDGKNNVEQVVVENPPPGKYTVKVLAARVTVGGALETLPARQAFALVYGQPLGHGVVARVDRQRGRAFLLDDGTLVVRDREQPLLATLDGARVFEPEPEDLRAGFDLYYAGPRREARRLYLVGRTLEASGMRTLRVGEDTLLLEVNAQWSEGGFRVARAEVPVASMPPGADVTGILTPTTGEVWDLKASWREVRGTVAAFEPGRGVLRLREDGAEYLLAPWAAFGAAFSWQERPPWDAPFGAGVGGSGGDPIPGASVGLCLSPRTELVTWVEVEQRAVAGILEALDTSTGVLRLEGSSAYRLVPGSVVFRDGRSTGPGALQPGDYVVGLLGPAGTRDFWRVHAYSRVVYGKVIYPAPSSLVLREDTGEVLVLPVEANPEVVRHGRSSSWGNLREGDWVRLFLREDRIWRADVATPAGQPEASVVVAAYEEGYLLTTRGERYLVTPRTCVLKDGWPVRASALRPGEQVATTGVWAADGSQKILAAVEGQSLPGSRVPAVSVTVPERVREPLVEVRGSAPGTRLYLTRGGTVPEEMDPEEDGLFRAQVALERPGITRITVVAVDRETGGVSAQTVAVYWPGECEDLVGHWAQDAVRRLVLQGLVRGYPDGTFRPEESVARKDFLVLLGRALRWPPSPDGPTGFVDQLQLTGEEGSVLRAALSRGVVRGYPDGTFRGGQALTRAEAAVLLARALTLPPGEGRLPFRDKGEIPPWALSSVLAVHEAGLMVGRDDLTFDAQGALTRAEAAVVMGRVLNYRGR
ncbi:MAG: S8 family serine peptidase [Desulfotomaculales bacterium]